MPGKEKYECSLLCAHKQPSAGRSGPGSRGSGLQLPPWGGGSRAATGRRGRLRHQHSGGAGGRCPRATPARPERAPAPTLGARRAQPPRASKVSVARGAGTGSLGARRPLDRAHGPVLRRADRRPTGRPESGPDALARCPRRAQSPGGKHRPGPGTGWASPRAQEDGARLRAVSPRSGGGSGGPRVPARAPWRRVTLPPSHSVRGQRPYQVRAGG